MDRARDPQAMKQTIEGILREGLTREVQDLCKAMENPQLFRKWIHEQKDNVSERLIAERVLYRASLPKSIEEKMILLLDGGFQPKKLLYLKELARTTFKNKCKELEDKLKITVDKSASVFMVPDFHKVLQPNEVYIDLSRFVDKSSEISGINLYGQEVIISRSPAHLVSDVQKVTVVAKAEFMGLKDIIVFPTTGDWPSLAAKLSGGDYDGDRAWVCWEPAIVNNFVNADVPECPDLIALGYIRDVSEPYSQLVTGHQDTCSVFLKKSFQFNMQPSLVGICTDYKDDVCWTMESVNTRESVWLSALLSSLVDAPKQGLLFNEDDFTRFKREEIKVKTRQPHYKKKNLEGCNATSKHILDYLKFRTHEIVQKALTEFEGTHQTPHYWDEDLAKQYKLARDMGATNDEWKTIVTDLDKDLATLASKWRRHFERSPYSEEVPEYLPFVDECYEIYLDIKPRDLTGMARYLLPSSLS